MYFARVDYFVPDRLWDSVLEAQEPQGSVDTLEVVDAGRKGDGLHTAWVEGSKDYQAGSEVLP